EAHKTEMASLIPRGMYLRLTSPMSETKYMAVFAMLDAAGYSYSRPRNYIHPKFWKPNPVPLAWLTKRTTFDEVVGWVRAVTVSDGWFSDNADEFSIILEHFRPSDEVWKFCSPPATWAALMGFAFVRDGIPYDHLIRVMI